MTAYNPHPKAHNFNDLTGQRFGRLVVLGYQGEYKKSYWHCQCDCGGESKTLASNLRRGKAKSCGCLAKDVSMKNNSTHGMRKTPEYGAWAGMKDRCLNKNSQKYTNYGGSGVTVCEEWINSFEQFYADMGDKPTAAHSLDRIENSKGYSAANCRWATKFEQTINRRQTIFLTHLGLRKPLAVWCKEKDIPLARSKARFYSGYCAACILSTDIGISCDKKAESRAA